LKLLLGWLLVAGCGGGEAIEVLPPSLPFMLGGVSVVVEASWVGDADNPGTSNPTASWAEIEILWSEAAVVVAKDEEVAVPDPPDPLTVWAADQRIDRYEPGERFMLALAYVPNHPYGAWQARLVLEADSLNLPADIATDPSLLINIPSDLERLYDAPGTAGMSKTEALVALVQEIRSRRNAINSGEAESTPGPLTTAVVGEENEPTQAQILAEWRKIPVEVRSLMLEWEVPEGSGIVFVPLNLLVEADSALSEKYDGFRLITSEGYVVTHVFPLTVSTFAGERTVKGSDIRVTLYAEANNAASENLFEVGVIPWSDLEPGTPLRLTINETKLEVVPLSATEFEAIVDSGG
jgi:hypothetical protein